MSFALRFIPNTILSNISTTFLSFLILFFLLIVTNIIFVTQFTNFVSFNFSYSSSRSTLATQVDGFNVSERVEEIGDVEDLSGDEFPTFVFMPILGLGNRLRALQNFEQFKAICGLNYMGIKSYTVWIPADDLNATYDELFVEPKFEEIDLKRVIASKSFRIITKDSVSLPPDRISQWLGIGEDEVLDNTEFNFDLLHLNLTNMLLCPKKYVIIMSAWRIGPIRNTTRAYFSKDLIKKVMATSKMHPPKQIKISYRPRTFFNLFKPAESIQLRLKWFKEQVLRSLAQGSRFVGLHFRQTDMLTHLNYDQFTANFTRTIYWMKKRLKHGDVLFVSTDERRYLPMFADELSRPTVSAKVLYHNFTNAHRNSQEGMENAVLDVYSLSLCDELWGNAKFSSFVKLAAQLSAHYVAQREIPLNEKDELVVMQKIRPQNIAAYPHVVALNNSAYRFPNLNYAAANQLATKLVNNNKRKPLLRYGRSVINIPPGFAKPSLG